MPKNPLKINLLINKYQRLITQINELEKDFNVLSNDELRAKSSGLQILYQQQKNSISSRELDSFLTECFALTREASVRTLGLRHFDVQLLGGLVLNNGKIAEMKTGEGKTLVATLPTFFNALTNNGVHIVTVNDYLAKRDQISMGQIYRFLGLDTGLIKAGMARFERKKNYSVDVTYVTNYELVFDYLHDNMALNIEDIVLRPFNYCIVDEVDSILIDEAQTPLIIANPTKILNEKYIGATEIINYLETNLHFKVDEKNKNIILTADGLKQIETILTIQDLYDPTNPWIPYIINALKANYLYFNNIHYIIQNDRVVIVDEFTGRIMPDRRWSEGLHQAIEAKEKLPIRKSTETVASITYQNFFLLYDKLSGMTGTGKTAEIEFEKIYKLSVKNIPTARPNIRKDLPDLIYKDQFSKWNAVAQECNRIFTNGQPILIGTTTVEKSEMLGQLLNEYKLSYQILNAKPENVRKESEIVAQAGKKNTITIATNMAGRGTDIILGGNIKFESQKKLYEILTYIKNYSNKQIEKNQNILLTNKNDIFALFTKFKGISQKFLSILLSLTKDYKFLNLSDIDILKILRESDKVLAPTISYQYSVTSLVDELLLFNKKHHEQDNKIVKNLGGLYIIGTERNDSKRIDNQLRGRSGRQGDPGSSRFLLSLDDNLLRLFSGSKTQNFIRNQLFDDSPLESKLITKSLNRAQTRVEERAYELRKNLFEYDDVLNKQRKTAYYERKRILLSQDIRAKFLAYFEQALSDSTVIESKPEDGILSTILFTNHLLGRNIKVRFIKSIFNSKIKEKFLEQILINLIKKSWLTYYYKIFGLEFYVPDLVEKFVQRYLLIIHDQSWKEHLQKMTLLREAVGWRGYGQKNPLYEYKEEAYALFKIHEMTIKQLILFDCIRTSIL